MTICRHQKACDIGHRLGGTEIMLGLLQTEMEGLVSYIPVLVWLSITRSPGIT